MARTSKEEIDQAIGRRVVQEAAKETSRVLGAAAPQVAVQELREARNILKEAAQQSLGVDLIVFRRDPTRGTDVFVPPVIHNLDPKRLEKLGLHPIIEDKWGGGSYKVHMRVEGIPDQVANIEVEGKPKIVDSSDNGDQRNLSGLSPLAQKSPLQNDLLQYYLHQQKPQQKEPSMIEMMMLLQKQQSDQQTAMMNMMLAQKTVAKEPEKNEKEKHLEQEIQALKDQLRQRESDTRFERMQQEHREEMRKIMERLETTNKPSPVLEIASAIGPSLIKMGESFMSSRREDNAMFSSILKSMADVQNVSNNQQLKYLELLQQKPTTEDRLAKQAETMAAFMGASIGNMGTLVNGILSQYQGSDKPAWLEVVTQLIEGATAVLSGGLPGMGEGDDEEESPMMMPAAQRVAPVEGEAPQISPAIDARRRAFMAAKAQEAARLHAARGAAPAPPAPPAPEEAATDAALGETGSRPRHPIPGWDTSLQKIAEIIEEKGNYYEAAYRLYNHQASNNRLAVEWWLSPPEKTADIFDTLAETDEVPKMDIEEEQLLYFVEAVETLREHLEQGGDLTSFLEKYEVDRPPPKTDNVVIRRRPQKPAEDAIGSPQFSTVGELELREITEEEEVKEQEKEEIEEEK